MPDIVPAEPNKVPAAPKRRRPPRIPKRVRHALSLIASGECATVKAAAERVGLSREHLSRMLGRDHVQAFLTQKARKTIAEGVLRASARVLELLDAGSEHVSLDAARHVLAIEGIKPVEGPQVAVNVAISPGYVIDLRDPREAVIEGAPDQQSGGDDA